MLTQRMAPSVLRATALVSALALVACSSDDPTNPGGVNGSFSATITGGVTASFSGVAIQGEADVEQGQPGWVLLLGDASTGANSIFIVHYGSRPTNGTYQLIDLIQEFLPGDWGAVIFLDDGTTIPYAGFSLSGTVTITSSSPDRVEGTYNFQVSDGGLPPVVATVTGTFSAVSGAVNLPG